MTRTRWMTLGAALLTLAGQAQAGTTIHFNPHGETGSRTVEMVTIDNGDKYEVIIKDDTAVAKVNGIRVAEDLVKVEGSRVIILDDDGGVIKKFELARTPDAPSVPSLRSANRGAVGGAFFAPFGSSDDDHSIGAIVDEKPPVMLGVLLEPANEALQAQLGVSEYAILLEKVMEGLPADKAGLKQWDIIVGVDGDEIDEPGMLGKILMESEPGDELELKIIRGGETMSRTLELAAYDSAKLGITVSIGTGQGDVQRWTWGTDRNGIARFPGLNPTDNREASESIEKLVRQLEAARAAGGDADEAKTRILEQLQRVERELAAKTEALRINRFPMVVDAQGRLILDEDEREQVAGELESRLEQIEAQFEDRLASLEDQLEARWEKMEHMLDRMFDRFEQMLDESKKDRD